MISLILIILQVQSLLHLLIFPSVIHHCFLIIIGLYVKTNTIVITSLSSLNRTLFPLRITIQSALESPYHLVAVSGAHFTQGTILIVIIVSSGSAKSRTHQSAVGGFLVTRRGWPGRLRACRIWTFINSV